MRPGPVGFRKRKPQVKVLEVARRIACWTDKMNKSWNGRRSHDWWVGLAMQNLKMCLEVCILSMMESN